MNDERIWTDEQVENANAFQEAGYMHPFTCGSEGCRADLKATPQGWICPTGCGYTQNWAHGFMLDGSAVECYRAMWREFRGEEE